VTLKIAAAVIACMIAGLDGSAQRPAADPLEDLLTRARTAQAGVKTITASFVETTFSSLLRDPIVTAGTLVAQMPVRVVMTYTAPAPKVLALDDRRLIVVVPSEKRRDEIDIASSQRRVRKYFIDASPGQLREQFDITLSSDSDGVACLDMSPKRRQIAEGLQRLRIWIDRTRMVMVKMTMDFPGGDSKTLELRNVRTNVAIDETAFALLGREK
jgi:outer membrane lipoprotein-sorting protein